MVLTAIPEKSDLWSESPTKVIPRIGLKSEDGVEGKNDETGDPLLLGCPRACDIQDINWVLRQPIFALSL